MSYAWKGGSGRGWRKKRAQVLEANRIENGGLCTVDVGKYCTRHQKRCSNICTGIADTAHHTKGKAATGDDIRYIVAACKACNLHLGQPWQRSPEPRPTSKW